MSLRYINLKDREAVFIHIKDCDEGGHFQQVVYSVHGNCLTQICFNCEKVVSNY